MGERVRDRIWNYLDDPEFRRHDGLHNALYRLLVAVEIPNPVGSPYVDEADASRCLDLAAAAVRSESTEWIARVGDLVDQLVERLAMIAYPALEESKPSLAAE